MTDETNADGRGDVKDRPIPVLALPGALDALAAWTPAVHHADWMARRAWPPGFRQVADNSVYDSKHEPEDERAARALPRPLRKLYWALAEHLLAYRLIDGVRSCARLTPRGRAALKDAGRPCPDAFVSHCTDIFDDVPLVAPELADGPDIWRNAVREAKDHAEYGMASTCSRAAVTVTVPSGERSLNGSLREHGRWVQFSVRTNDHLNICEFALSFEQFAEMLVHRGEVTATVDRYVDANGMLRTEPAPRPISAYDRMQARIENHRDEQAVRIEQAMDIVRSAKMGKKAQEDILHALATARRLGTANAAYVAQQTLEEISAVVEGAQILLAEKTGGADRPALAAAPDSDVLGSIR